MITFLLMVGMFATISLLVAVGAEGVTNAWRA